MIYTGKRILLGVTGGIAAYKAAELVRRLICAGARVKVVMTAGGPEFVGPLTFQALTGETVATAMFGPEAEPLEHVSLGAAGGRHRGGPGHGQSYRQAGGGDR